MKLSEMNTAQLADALVRLAEPLCRIGRDPALNQALADFGRFDSDAPVERITSLFVPVSFVLLRGHPEDTLTVLSILTGKTPAELAAQNGLQTIREAWACLDGELMDFFR